MYILNLSVYGSHGFCKQVVCHLSGDDKTCCSDNKCFSILLFKFNMIYMLLSFMQFGSQKFQFICISHHWLMKHIYVGEYFSSTISIGSYIHKKTQNAQFDTYRSINIGFPFSMISAAKKLDDQDAFVDHRYLHSKSDYILLYIYNCQIVLFI